MRDALRKLDRKFLILAGCLIFIPLIIIIFLVIIQSCGSGKTTYEKYEKKMIAAATKYVKKNDSIPVLDGEYIIIDLNMLENKGYIKSSEKLLDDDSCTGNVVVRRNGAIDENEGYLNYTVNLTCDNYSTNNLKNLAMKDLVTEDSGLYSVGDKYVFKGTQPNNYLKLFGKMYRIISIDKEGIAKIIRTESEAQHLYWDMKYNSEIDESYGLNIYEDSFILEKLNSYYMDEKRTKQNLREKLVAYDVCVDKKDINDYSLNYGNNCTNILKGQRYTLLNVADFANASLDKECTGINSKSCKNYNYMGRMALYTWTMTAVSNNTYQVYYLEGSTIRYQEANRYNGYNIVMHIDSNELVSSGNGSKEKPYVIE